MKVHLDHAGLVVRDLWQAAGQFAALGFALTPRSHHTVTAPDGALRPAGTANHCAMLERGYVEIVAVTDPAASSFSRDEIGGFLERFEGLHLLAMGTADAEAAERRLGAAGRDLSRSVGEAIARFRLVPVPALSGPEMTFFFIQHRTRELVWRQGATEHPNGALGLLELVIVADEPAAAASRYGTVLGGAPVAHEGAHCFELEDSRLLVMSPAAATAWFGGELPVHGLPHCAGQAIEVGDIARTEAVLAGNEVPFRRRGNRLTVAPPHAGGAYLQFVEGMR